MRSRRRSGAANAAAVCRRQRLMHARCGRRASSSACSRSSACTCSCCSGARARAGACPSHCSDPSPPQVQRHSAGIGACALPVHHALAAHVGRSEQRTHARECAGCRVPAPLPPHAGDGRAAGAPATAATIVSSFTIARSRSYATSCTSCRLCRQPRTLAPAR